MSMSDKGVYSFLNSIPQVVTYGIALQEQCGIQVKNIIFNENGAWVFDPNGMLTTINDFMEDSKGSYIPPWIEFN